MESLQPFFGLGEDCNGLGEDRNDMICMVEDLAAEALFVSDLQPSQCPTGSEVAEAVTAMILRYGSDGCAGCVASEFGDHPEAAVRRMSWVRSSLRTLVATPRSPQPAS